MTVAVKTKSRRYKVKKMEENLYRAFWRSVRGFGAAAIAWFGASGFVGWEKGAFVALLTGIVAGIDKYARDSGWKDW